MENYNFDVPKASDTHCLVKLERRYPPASRNSEKARRAAIEDMVAKGVNRKQAEEQVSARIQLFPDGELKAIQKPFNAFDTYMRRVTIRWLGGKGSPVLTSVHKIDELESKFSQAQLAVYPMVQAFVSNYAATLDKLEQNGGEYFDRSMYIEPSRIADAFHFNLTFQPISNPDDFTIGGVTEQKAEELRKRMSDALDRAANEATQAYAEDLRSDLQHIASQLTTGKRFHAKGLLARLNDRLSADLNITRHAGLADVIQDAGKVTQLVEVLTDKDANQYDKDDAARAAQQAATKLAGMF